MSSLPDHVVPRSYPGPLQAIPLGPVQVLTSILLEVPGGGGGTWGKFFGYVLLDYQNSFLIVVYSVAIL